MTDSSIHSSRVRALTIAGVDPSGGAGICADLKSFSAFGAYGMTVIAGLTAQNTQGVTGIGKINPDFLKQQLETLSNDIQIDTIKIGMLSTKENANIVKSWLKSLKNQENKETFVVLDPVMVATSGNRLLAEDAEKAVLELAEEADIITPNLPELKRMVEILQGQASDQLVAKIDSAT
ncbi:MAG: bifunctional hydroxymethylpyrimidine kinase/phosphomethylpyrimidine kinase, partial [Candidatus Ancillula sp.]|nr:bifunctional hydroxymethylpyrimidine kinase/phosphomethylpyrimidine kinase [Candidatus Ancillula sp.]